MTTTGTMADAEMAQAGKAKRPVYRAASKAPSASKRGPRLASAADVAAQCQDIAAAHAEHFVAFDVDVRHRVIARRVVSVGTLTGVEVNPREVFRPAIVNGAAAMIIAHNHPSGDPSPSRADIELTRRLRDVGEMVGITILDHLVIGGDGWVSMASDSIGGF